MSPVVAHRDAPADGPSRRNWVNSGRGPSGLIPTQRRHRLFRSRKGV